MDRRPKRTSRTVSPRLVATLKRRSLSYLTIYTLPNSPSDQEHLRVHAWIPYFSTRLYTTYQNWQRTDYNLDDYVDRLIRKFFSYTLINPNPITSNITKINSLNTENTDSKMFPPPYQFFLENITLTSLHHESTTRSV